MRSFAAASTLLAIAALVAAEPNPRTPPQTNIGSPLNIIYDVDPTGTWRSCTVSLMSGSNFDMVKVTDIDANHDCTAPPGQISWPVPEVSPTSLIYFIQFTNNANATETPVWTTRFAIANNGQTTPPVNPTQENGDAIPWGIGALGANGGGDQPSSASDVSSAPSSSLPASSSGPDSFSSSAFSTPSSSSSIQSSTPAPSSRPASSSRAINIVSSASSRPPPSGAASSVKTGSAAAGVGVALVAALAGMAFA